MKKIDLTDTTFMIPVRIDSMIRLENVLLVTEFLLSHFHCRMILLESASSTSVLKRLISEEIQYIYEKDQDPIFYKTKFVNRMAINVDTPYLAVWDADIIAAPSQIEGAVNQLRENDFDVSFPFDGCCYDTSDIIQACFNTYRTFCTLTNHIGKMDLMYGMEVVGGALFSKTEVFLMAGGDNEDFYGWGPEDHERFERFIKLGYKIYRELGPLFHLSHPRGINSTYRTKRYGCASNYILRQTRSSSEDEILKNQSC